VIHDIAIGEFGILGDRSTERFHIANPHEFPWRRSTYTVPPPNNLGLRKINAGRKLGMGNCSRLVGQAAGQETEVS
jgi:hypothetical protein